VIAPTASALIISNGFNATSVLLAFGVSFNFAVGRLAVGENRTPQPQAARLNTDPAHWILLSSACPALSNLEHGAGGTI